MNEHIISTSAKMSPDTTTCRNLERTAALFIEGNQTLPDAWRGIQRGRLLEPEDLVDLVRRPLLRWLRWLRFEGNRYGIWRRVGETWLSRTLPP